MKKIKAKNLKEAKKNLAIAKAYYNRNMVFLNYDALQQAKRELKHYQDKCILIPYRIKNKKENSGWSEKRQRNESKTHCDKCKAKLWISPAKIIYCDNEH